MSPRDMPANGQWWHGKVIMLIWQQYGVFEWSRPVTTIHVYVYISVGGTETVQKDIRSTFGAFFFFINEHAKHSNLNLL